MLAGRVFRVLLPHTFPALLPVHHFVDVAPEPEICVDKSHSNALCNARSLNYLGRSHLPGKFFTPANEQQAVYTYDL